MGRLGGNISNFTFAVHGASAEFGLTRIEGKVGKPTKVIFKKRGGQTATEHVVCLFSYAQGVGTGGVVLNDFMFRKPPRKPDSAINAETEVYDRAGRYPVTDHGNAVGATGARRASVRADVASTMRPSQRESLRRSRRGNWEAR